jgi:hypothetical protein
MSLPEYKEECYILDDEELAKADAAPKPEPDYEKRSWKINDSERVKNPFQKGYIKSANTFPTAFQYKPKSPGLHPIRAERKTSVENMSTFSLLEKVKTILQEQPQYKEKVVETESRTPPYGPD